MNYLNATAMLLRNRITWIFASISVCVTAYVCFFWLFPRRPLATPSRVAAVAEVSLRDPNSASEVPLGLHLQNAHRIFVHEGFAELGQDPPILSPDGVRTYSDGAGSVVRTTRTDSQGRILVETRFHDGASLSFEWSYDPEGKLTTQRQRKNGRLVREEVFRR